MLKPDDARRELSPFKSAKHLKARVSRLAKLPKAAAAAGLGLFDMVLKGKSPSNWDDIKVLQTHCRQVLGQDAAVRKKVLAALYPTFAKEIELGVKAIEKLTYTTDYNRRPFRAPTRPDLYSQKIFHYLKSINECIGEIADDAITPEWVATWAVHLGYYNSNLGYLFAGQIDAGQKEILEILKDSAANRHAIGGPGSHAIRGLLCCQNPEAWQFVANLLLAAQRQEGLRQSILEEVDESNLEAFRLILRIVLDQNLIRFAAVARAASVWLGEELMVEDTKNLKSALVTLQEYLGSPASRSKALKNGDANSLYIALWAIANEDVIKAIDTAKPVLKEKNSGRKIAVIKLLTETGLSETADLVLPFLEDADTSVQSAALAYFTHFDAVDRSVDAETKEKPYPKKLFESLEKILPSLPAKPKAVKSPVPTWKLPDLSQQVAADLLKNCLQKRPVERLLPWIKMMTPYYRVEALERICKPRTLTSKVRATLMACATETNARLREAALGHLKKCTLAEDEVRTLEGLLTRKQPDFRRGVFELLLNRSDKLVLQSIERLLPGDVLQRAAGIELARRMSEAERVTVAVHAILSEFQASKGAKLSEADREVIDRILNPQAAPPTLEDGLGLFNPKDRSPVVKLQKKGIKVTSPAAVAFLKSLDELIHEHRDKTYVHVYRHGHKEEMVLGSIRYSHQFAEPDEKVNLEEDLKNLPLKEIWLEWWKSRPSSTRDADGLELLRVNMLHPIEIRDGEEDSEIDEDDADDDDETKKFKEKSIKKAVSELHPMPPVRLKYYPVIEKLILWFLKLTPPQSAIDHTLEMVEHCLAFVPDQMIQYINQDFQYTDEFDNVSIIEWRSSGYYREESHNVFVRGFKLLEWLTKHQSPTPEQIKREYRLQRWLEEPAANVRRKRVGLNTTLKAYEHGAATLADFYDLLIGPRFRESYGMESFDELRTLTYSRPEKDELRTFWQKPELQKAFHKVLDRVAEVERERGETASAATEAAKSINTFPGIHHLLPIMELLDKNGFKKSSYSTGSNKPEVLTSLIQAMVPNQDETPEAFAKAIQPWIESGKIKFERVVELGMVNPRLIKHAAAVINWPGYEETCYWFMAHADSSHARALQRSDSGDLDESEKQWRDIVKTRSNLSAEQRADGVIDVDWFHKAYAALGRDDRWDAIEKAARFLGYGYAEKKAARLADVLLGRMKKKDLVDNIQKKFLKESVRLLGLLPLPEDSKKRDAELADRYKVLKAYERYARGLSSLSKEPAMQSYRLGMQNLAVTAGFSDPVRLEWAVTARETADLAKGPVSVKVKDVLLMLSLGDFAEPITTPYRGKEVLKSLPKETKANKAVEELLERKKDLKRLVSNTKRTLELAMCAGDQFSAAELRNLMVHPIVRPFIERLVLKTSSGMGYPVQEGKALRGADGKTTLVKDEWSIAHPLDFVKKKNWQDYQAECFRNERIQPFKQVFREVYTLTPAEKEDNDKSRRYSGQQVNENQAKALLSSRGWSTREDLSKLYRAEDISVDLILDYGFTTPGDAAAPAVKELRFTKRGQWESMRLEDVLPVIFSEVMRDLDMVVSVAHVGGVDPESTQSTVAMRASLLQETCSLLKLDNVKLDSKHALIQGEYGKYSVHLGSGVVHKQPGGSLCVVAVNAQHRGRLFLPFADDDPRTAEVISKVLLLSRDKEIQDPTILQQIVTR